MFDFDEFRARFPAFDCLTDAEIQPYVDMACAIHGDFCYVTNPKTQALMVLLSVAHELQMGDCKMTGGAIKRIKNQQDEIEYARAASDDPYGLDATVYGARLANLSKVYCASSGFIAGGVASLYASDIGYVDECDCGW